MAGRPRSGLVTLLVWALASIGAASGDMAGVKQQYIKEREALLAEERSWHIGSTLELSEAERKLDEVYRRKKAVILELGYKDEYLFKPAQYFLSYYQQDPNLDVYRMIEMLPKGALLHVHESSSVSADFLVNLTLSNPRCRMCYDKSHDSLLFNFTDPETVEEVSSRGLWCGSCSQAEDGFTSRAAFHDWVRGYVTLMDGRDYTIASVEDVWASFGSKFQTIDSAVTYIDLWEQIVLQVLHEFYQDGVQYAEWRMVIQPYLDYSGAELPFSEVLNRTRTVIDLFKLAHPDFFGINIVLTSLRLETREYVAEKMRMAEKMHGLFPSLVVGFDLVGYEEAGRSLLYFIDDLLAFRQRNPHTMPFVFHAGETDWRGFPVDQNILDAVLLNTSRIGHAYSLEDHSSIVSMIRQKDIAIEINPISNQVLQLVRDLRNHRHGHLLSVANKPGPNSEKPILVTVNSDDPMIWGAKPLTDDMYAAVLALGQRRSGIEVIKQLAINSIRASLLDTQTKARLMASWEARWNATVHQLVHIISQSDTDSLLLRPAN